MIKFIDKDNNCVMTLDDSGDLKFDDHIREQEYNEVEEIESDKE